LEELEVATKVRELPFFAEADDLGLNRLVIKQNETTFTREPNPPAALFFEMTRIITKRHRVRYVTYGLAPAGITNKFRLIFFQKTRTNSRNE
jgi:hypothetical protein